MNNLIFDCEVFASFWCICTLDMNNVKGLITSDDLDAQQRVKRLIINNRLIGFNCRQYDLIILNAISMGLSTNRVRQVSDDIINNLETPWTKTFNHYRWDWIDLFNDWRFGSLKMYEANQGLAIVESSIPFTKQELTDAEKAEIISYCQYDVAATMCLWQARRNYFSIHEFVSAKYGVPLRKAYQRTMQSLVAEATNTLKPTNIMPEDKREDIYVLDYIYEQLGSDLDIFKFLVASDSDERMFLHNGTMYTLGVGGVHSDYGQPIDVTSGKEFNIFGLDFTQYYPNMLLKFNLMPRSMNEEGIAIFQGMVNEVKRLKTEVKALYREQRIEDAEAANNARDRYKVLINAPSGAMRNKYSKFFDPARIVTMCCVGQFLLIAIVADMQKTFPGTDVLQTNTDGAFIMVPVKYSSKAVHDKLESIKALINFDIELDDCQRMIQRDVNNYLLVESDGKVKSRGSWAYKERDSFKPASYAICHKAVYNLMLFDQPIEETIRSSTNVMDFVRCAKTGGTFEKTVLVIKDDAEVEQNNVNRFVASLTPDGMLYKVKDGKRNRVPDCPNNCKLLNNAINEYKFEDLNIDYDFYIKYAYELIPNFYTFI